eukprot:COSAG05_NODE_10372_length_569_cov_0.493617_1_plen_22_part_10
MWGGGEGGRGEEGVHRVGGKEE